MMPGSGIALFRPLLPEPRNYPRPYWRRAVPAWFRVPALGVVPRTAQTPMNKEEFRQFRRFWLNGNKGSCGYESGFGIDSNGASERRQDAR